MPGLEEYDFIPGSKALGEFCFLCLGLGELGLGKLLVDWFGWVGLGQHTLRVHAGEGSFGWFHLCLKTHRRFIGG